MALIEATSRPGYVKTGEDGQSGWGAAFARWSNTATYIPWVGSLLALPLGAIGTVIDTFSALFDRKGGGFGSALTALAAGSAATATNTAVSASGLGSVVWWGNAASGLATGRTLGSHVRMGTESVIGGITGALGIKPRILQSNFGAIGSLDVPQQSAGPHLAAAAASKGADADAVYARMQSNQADHLAALDAARAQGANYGRA